MKLKQFYLTTFASLALVLTAFADEPVYDMKIELKGGGVTTIPVEEVERVTFVDRQAESFNILTPEYIPDETLRNAVKSQVARGAATLTNVQAAAFDGNLVGLGEVVNFDGLQYFRGLTGLSLEANSNVTMLDLHHLRNLETLNVQYCENLQLLNLEGLNKLKSLWIGWSALKNFDYTKLPSSLTEFRAQYLDYGAIDLSRFPNLETLSLSGNLLTVLDVSALPLLQELTADNNPDLKTVTFGRHENMQVLNVSSCLISKLDLSPCPNLTDIYVQHNTQLTSLGNIDMDSFVQQLVRLNVSYTGIVIRNFDGACGLVQLEMQECPLYCNLDLSDCESLKRLRVERTGITGLNIQNSTLLEELHCFDNNIRELHIDNMPHLNLVNAFDNDISEFSCNNLPSMWILSIANNLIPRVDISTINPDAQMIQLFGNKMGEIKVWPSFNLNNPPASISKDARAVYVYEFSE